MSGKTIKRTFLYTLMVLFVIADYLTLPSGSYILDKLKSSGQLNLLFPLIYVTILSIAVFSTGSGLERFSPKKLFPVMIAIFANAFYFSKLPDADKAHFLEYELVTLITFKALEIDIRRVILYPITVAAVSLIGIIEEILQAFYPDRSFDLQDFKTDFFSSLLMMLVVYTLSRKSARYRKGKDSNA